MFRRFSFVALLLPLASGAAAQGDPANDPVALGRELVEIYCAACHSIEGAGDSPHDQAPPFRELHERYELEWLEEGLVEGLVSGHPDMPEFEFDPDQAQAILAYLETLTPAPKQ